MAAMKVLCSVLLLCLVISVTNGASPCDTGGIGQYVAAPGMCAWVFASGLTRPRGIIQASNNDMLVIEGGRVTVLFDTNGDGIIQANEKATLATQSSLNHAVMIQGGYVYASSDTTVYRWAYTAGKRSNLGAATTVLVGMPGGGHTSRTLEFDSAGALYIVIGSGSNIDKDSSRARVVKCAVDLANIPAGGYHYSSSCVAFGDGSRNECGIRFDPKGRLWGVENGMDNVQRADLGGDIHNANPCEEVNLYDTAGFYGYPYCWSEMNLTNPRAGGPKTQWAHESTINDGIHSDAWCKDTKNVRPPVWCMQAHTAPLDLLFHNSPTFAAPFKSGMFVSQHGSWNRQPPTGYRVVHLTLDANFMPIREDILISNGKPLGDNQQWTHRPVALAKLTPCGPLHECLLVTSDASNAIIAVGMQS